MFDFCLVNYRYNVRTRDLVRLDLFKKDIRFWSEAFERRSKKSKCLVDCVLLDIQLFICIFRWKFYKSQYLTFSKKWVLLLYVYFQKKYEVTIIFDEKKKLLLIPGSWNVDNRLSQEVRWVIMFSIILSVKCL